MLSPRPASLIGSQAIRRVLQRRVHVIIIGSIYVFKAFLLDCWYSGRGSSRSEYLTCNRQDFVL